MTAPAADIAVPDPSRAVRRELGRPANITAVYSTRGDVSWKPVYADPNPVLRFPTSVQTFDVMARTDDQVDSVLRAIRLPMLDAPWNLETEGVPADVVAFVRQQIGLPEPGKSLPPRRKGQAGVNFIEHLEEALDALTYGFMAFEQVYQVTVPGDPGHPTTGTLAQRPAVAHLKKLAARAPATIDQFVLASDGGLEAILQKRAEGDPAILQATANGDVNSTIPIPITQLVIYVNGKKGADWTGISVLRTAYKPWKMKDDFCRTETVAAERVAMGVPVVHYDDQVFSKDEALEIATAYRTGSNAGIALPPGVTLEFTSPGQVVDLGPKIDRANQAIGRASLAMFLNLGHDNGARALGDTFMDFFIRSEQATANRVFGQTFTEHVIADLVRLNFGEDSPYPRLVPGEITAETLSPEALSSLIAADVIRPDDVLEATMRRRYRMPEADTATSRKEKPAPEPTPEPVAVPVEEDPEPDPEDPDAEEEDGEDPPAEKPKAKVKASGYAAYLNGVVQRAAAEG